MTPAEELAAAATKLRETAAKTTPGAWITYPATSRDDDRDDQPWTVSTSYCANDGSPCEPTCDRDVVVAGECLLRAGDAAWIVLACPMLAAPLAALLDDQVGIFDTFADSVAPDFAERIALPALRLARLINGGAS